MSQSNEEQVVLRDQVLKWLESFSIGMEAYFTHFIQAGYENLKIACKNLTKEDLEAIENTGCKILPGHKKYLMIGKIT